MSKKVGRDGLTNALSFLQRAGESVKSNLQVSKMTEVINPINKEQKGSKPETISMEKFHELQNFITSIPPLTEDRQEDCAYAASQILDFLGYPVLEGKLKSIDDVESLMKKWNSFGTKKITDIKDLGEATLVIGYAGGGDGSERRMGEKRLYHTFVILQTAQGPVVIENSSSTKSIKIYPVGDLSRTKSVFDDKKLDQGNYEYYTLVPKV